MVITIDHGTRVLRDLFRGAKIRTFSHTKSASVRFCPLTHKKRAEKEVFLLGCFFLFSFELFQNKI